MEILRDRKHDRMVTELGRQSFLSIRLIIRKFENVGVLAGLSTEQGSDKETMMPEGVGYGGMSATQLPDQHKVLGKHSSSTSRRPRNPVVKLDRRHQVLTSKSQRSARGAAY